MMKILKNRWVWITTVALLVAAGFVFIRNNTNASATENSIDETAVAFIGDLSLSTSTSGSVEAVQTADLSVDSAGIVTDIYVRAGDQVTAGEPLVQLDRTDLLISVAQAEQTVALQQTTLQALLSGSRAEDIAAAEAAVVSAQATLDSLLAGPDEYDIAQSEANLRSQQAGVASAAANYGSTLDTITESQIAQAEIDLLNARTNYENAVDANEANPNGTTHDAMIDALEALQIAEKRLNELLDGPANGQITNSAGQLNAANANLTGAEADHNALLAGPSAEQIASAEANLARAEANLASLLEPVTDESIAIAEENLRQAEIALENAVTTLDGATIVAPFDGTITAIDVAVGEYATGTAVEITSEQLKVVLEVDEIDIAQVSIDQNALLTLETWPNETIAGEVTAIAPSAGTGDSVVSYDVTILLGETNLPILIGMTANADLITADFSDLLLVPSGAINADRAAGTYTVMQVTTGEDGQPTTVEVDVTIGNKTDEYIEIRSGLEAGDEVAIGQIEAPVADFFGPPGQ